MQSRAVSRLRPFALEDFFVEHEHRKGLINLASSDSLPWTLREITERCPPLETLQGSISLAYPNLESIDSSLTAHCHARPPLRVLPTSGTAEAILMVLAGLRDEKASLHIGLPRPSFGAFLGIAELLGCQVSTYDYKARGEWPLDLDRLLALADTCDVVVINNPHNPTGHLLPEADILRVNERLRAHHGVLVVDEVFRLDSDCASIVDRMTDVVVIGSLSKVYGFPGLRLGWLVASADRVPRFRTVQQYASLSPNSFAIAMGPTILDNISLFSRQRHIEANRQKVCQWTRDHSDILRVPSPQAGTTAILEIESESSEDALFDAFLEGGVLLVPGTRCFDVAGERPWFRLGYGGSEGDLQKGLDAIVATVKAFRD